MPIQVPPPVSLLPRVFWFQDTCNVYLIVHDGRSIAVDFGSGAWLLQVLRMGLPIPETVLLTHAHADSCGGLQPDQRPACLAGLPLQIHAPAGAAPWIEPVQVAEFWRTRDAGGVPSGYDVLPQGIPDVRYSLGGFEDFWWGDQRLRLLATPGHGLAAITVLADLHGQQVAFCGDAVHAGGTVHQPYALEWDHWTGQGALAAWEGLQRLGALAIDLLCPGHGPVVSEAPRATIATAAERVMAFYHAKGQIAVGQPDRYIAPIASLACGARQYREGLWQVGMNTWFLRLPSGRLLIVDPHIPDLDAIDALHAELGRPAVAATLASHYHYDHSDGLPAMKARYGAAILLHPRLSEVLDNPAAVDCPWRPPAPILPDVALPVEGVYELDGAKLRCAAFPGQTWWHAAHLLEHKGERLLFAGDSFQPPSRWNGTGGFCSYNGCRFETGFRASAQLVLDWRPDLLLNGHGTINRFDPAQFQAIQAWSARAETAVRALCPSGSLRTDYYLHPHPH